MPNDTDKLKARIAELEGVLRLVVAAPRTLNQPHHSVKVLLALATVEKLTKVLQ